MAMKITAKGIATKSKNGKVLDVYFHFINFNGTNIGKDLQEINTDNKELIEINVSGSELQNSISSIEDAYLKLHLLSYKLVLPNSLNLDGLFSILPNVAWTNKGPIAVDEIESCMRESRLNMNNLYIRSLDKFPCLTDYIVPNNVRIADVSRVRLGAYLSEGTTIMHEGFVNFNAGTLGKAMIEGRISSGVIVGDGSDLGGGCSTMGTLSGGNNVKISIGKNCLLGANSGLGIPLGDNCIVEAGLYLTSGTKVELFNENNISEGISKASELSGLSNLTFIRNSLNGKVTAKYNKNSISLNKELHKND